MLKVKSKFKLDAIHSMRIKELLSLKEVSYSMSMKWPA